jgi:hypothetical protein
MKLLRLVVAFFVIFCLLHGCATKEKHTYHVNEMGEVGVADGDLSSELQLVASAMTRAMMPIMQRPSRWPAEENPFVVIVEVDNRTEEFVDSPLVTNAIRAVLRSHDTLLILDGEFPLPDIRRFVSPIEEEPELELPEVRLPRQGTSLPLAIPGKNEPPLTQQFKRVPLQPAPVRTSEPLLPGRMPPPSEANMFQSTLGIGQQRRLEEITPLPNGITPPKGEVSNRSLILTKDRVFLTPPSSSAPDTPLSSHEDGYAPVRMSILTPSPDGTKLPESNAQKRERMLRLLEARLKKQEGYAPVYAIRTVLLPFAGHPADEGRKNKKEPYMFKMFVEDIRSETIKWANAWEVRKAASSISSIAGTKNDTGNSYRAPAAPNAGRSAEQGDNSILADNIRDFRNAEPIHDSNTIQEFIQK